MDLTLD